MDPSMLKGMLSGIPIEQIMQMFAEQGRQRPMQSQGPPPVMQQPMAASQGQDQGQNPMGMLSQILPMLMKAGRTGSPTSVMGSGGPLTVPAGSQISQMDPNIRGQLVGGGAGGGGLMGLLRGLF